MVTLQVAVLALAVTGAGETVLYDFSAPWCGPCRQMEPVVDRLTQMGHPVRKVNIDQDRALAARFGVSSIPCFVMVVDGREVAREVGLVSQARLEQMLDSVPRTVSRSDLPAETSVTRAAQQPRATAGFPRSAPEMTRTAADSTGRQPLKAPSRDVLLASVRLKVEDPVGHSYGSGTIIDARDGEALILTCGHIFRDSGGRGRITVDLFSPGAPQTLSGTLIRYDLTRDLGLVSIQTGPDVDVVRLARAGYQPRQGESVTAVGCDNGGEPTAHDTRITTVNRYLGPPNIQVEGEPAEGRSGGGLFNSQGELIGVCFAGHPDDDEGLYSALEAVRAELADAGLAGLLEADVSKRAPVDFAESSLSPPDERALTALKGAAGRAEVICIVRPLHDPGAKSEVVILDRASTDFLDQLTVERQRQDRRRLTSLEVPHGRPNQSSQVPAAASERLRWVPVPSADSWSPSRR